MEFVRNWHAAARIIRTSGGRSDSIVGVSHLHAMEWPQPQLGQSQTPNGTTKRGNCITIIGCCFRHPALPGQARCHREPLTQRHLGPESPEGFAAFAAVHDSLGPMCVGGRDGKRTIEQGTELLSTCPLPNLECRCPGNHSHLHLLGRSQQGARAAQSAAYPLCMCGNILQATRRIHEMCPDGGELASASITLGSLEQC